MAGKYRSAGYLEMEQAGGRGVGKTANPKAEQAGGRGYHRSLVAVLLTAGGFRVLGKGLTPGILLSPGVAGGDIRG